MNKIQQFFITYLHVQFCRTSSFLLHAKLQTWFRLSRLVACLFTFLLSSLLSRGGTEGGTSCLLCSAVCGVSVAARDLEPMGRKHVHETICNGKTNPVRMVWILQCKGESSRCFRPRQQMHLCFV